MALQHPVFKVQILLCLVTFLHLDICIARGILKIFEMLQKTDNFISLCEMDIVGSDS